MKKLLILFMPFFMVCCKEKKQHVHTEALLKKLLAEKKTDSLVIVGKQYQWEGNIAASDNGFKQYILTNYQIGDSIRQWEGRSSKKACIFYNNIVQHETALQSGNMRSIFVNALYKKTEPTFSYKYDETVVAAFEKCRQYQLAYPSLDSAAYFDVLQSLGIDYHLLCEKEKSIKYYNEAMALYQAAKNGNKVASASINRFRYFIEYGKYDSVISSAPFVLSLPNIKLKRIATIKAYYAEALYAKKNPSYKLQLDAALAMLNQLPDTLTGADELGKKSDILKLYGDINLKEKKYPAAIGHYKNALDTCLKQNNGSYKDRSYAKLLLSLAVVYDSLHQYDSALYYSQFALACVTNTDSALIGSNPSGNELYTENTIMEALDGKAGLLEKKYAITKDTSLLHNAITCYELAFVVEQKLLDNFTYDESRAQMQETSKKRSGKAIKACNEFYRLTNQNSWAEKAFRFSENSKALILLEAIKKNIHKSQNKDNPLLKQVDSLRLQLAYAERLLLTGKKSDSTILARKSQLEKALDVALAKLDNQGLGYKKYQQQENTDLLGEMRKKLLTDERYLAEFFWADSSNAPYLFVVKKTGPLFFAQLDKAVTDKIGRLMGFIAAQDSVEASDYKQAAHQLFQATGLQAALGAQELLLVPDGLFNQVPFDVLVTNSNGNNGYIGMDYLFQKITVSYGYSATSLLKQTDNHKTASGPAVAFAPMFAAGERNMQPLRNSKTEVDSIDMQMRYTGSNATVDNLRKIFATAGIIHIASHASADTGASGEPKIEMYDTAFYMNELYATSLLHTNLVVLSACQTNQGNINQSEGTLSLARGFYYAGAKNIVASLWNVDDRSTAKMMALFYKSKMGTNYAAKLRDAKQAYLRNQGPGGKIAPYYWAALMHIGGFGQPEEDLFGWWWYAVGAAVLLLALGWLYQKRRKRLG